MNITMKDAVAAYLAIEQLKTEKIPFDAALTLRKSRSDLSTAVTLYSERERALIEACAELDADGKPVITGNGRFKLRPEALQEWQTGKTDLDETEIEITRRRLSAITDISLTQLDALEKIFELPEIPEQEV